MFYEHICKFNDTFRPFSLFAPITDRKTWNKLDKDWIDGTLAIGKSFKNFNFPSLTATDFMDFCRTGNRSRFEDKCFGKRHALDALVLAECTEDNGEYIDDIINGIFSICEESAWQLPAHNTYIRDTPQHLLPDSTAPVLDLFACETGSILATVYYLLKERLNDISPFITKRIQYELDTRIFTPYLNSHFWWMGNGKEPMNNWTIWCTQNVLLTTFLMDAPEELRKDIVQKACKSVDYFLAEYGDDGCCDEGAQYYRHAGLCLFNVIETLNHVTNGHFTCMYSNEKIRNIAGYILNAHIQDKYYVNFADCSPVAGRCGIREYLFATRTDNLPMKQFAALDYVKGGEESLLLPKENNLYYRLQNAMYAKEVRKYAKCCNEQDITHPDIYYPSVGLFVARDASLYLAVKSGDNDDSHNHNDTGSFTVYKDGHPLLIDIGVESYTKKTFSPQRYEIWTMQSAYHNLPTINGYMQENGEKYKAKEVAYCFDDSNSEGNSVSHIKMDIADAYPAECGIESYMRHAKLIKGKEIEICDSIHFKNNTENSENNITLHFMTYEEPILKKSSKELIFAIGKVGELHLTSGSLLNIDKIPVTDARLMQTWKHDVYRINVSLDASEIKMRIM